VNGLQRSPLQEYEAVRANQFWFIVVPGHEQSEVPLAKPVQHRDGYVIVEKVGKAAELVEGLDE
jgi:hypothetical protein